MGRIPTTLLLRLSGGLLAAAAIVLAGCGGTSRASSHTVLLVLENRELGEAIGGPGSSTLDELSKQGALAVDYHAVAHPSLPNYLALIGGSTFGIGDDCTDCQARGANLATQLSAADISWRAYMGGMPRPCFRGAESGEYAKRHNPFLYFPAIAGNPKLCASVVPETELDTALTQHHLPSFAWISPDLCDDAHSCPLAKADEYLAALVPRLRRRLGRHGLLIVTFDEGSSNASCCGNAEGGRVATILVGPEVRKGARLHHPYSHYSLLATLEDRFGLPRLRNARSATTLTAAFKRLTGDPRPRTEYSVMGLEHRHCLESECDARRSTARDSKLGRSLSQAETCRSLRSNLIWATRESCENEAWPFPAPPRSSPAREQPGGRRCGTYPRTVTTCTETIRRASSSATTL